MESISFDLDVDGVPSERLRVVRLDAEEHLSRPFRFDVLFASPDPALDLGGLRGAATTLTLRQGSVHRTVRGCIGAIEQGEQASDGAYLYRALIVPRFALPTKVDDGSSLVPDDEGAIERALRLLHAREGVQVELRLARGAGAPASRCGGLVGGAFARCDPRRPDDLGHILSLLDGEGVALVLAQGCSALEPVLLVDNVDALPVVPWGETLAYVADEGSAPPDSPAVLFRVRNASAARSLAHGRAVGLAERWRRQGNTVLSGESSLCTLSAGHRFTLRDHFRDDLSCDYVILRVSHRAEAGHPGDAEDRPPTYRCTVEAARASAFDASLGAPTARRGAAARPVRHTLGRLPLEAQLLGGDFTEPSGGGSWARVYVPLPMGAGAPTSALGYLRLGATPTTDTTETPFQSFWPSTWPTANFNGAFLYTDTNRIFAAQQNAYEYTATERQLSVGLANAVTPTFRAESAYAPPSGTAVPPSAITGLTFASTAEINGSRKLTVSDLLVEEVLGDHVDYVRGSRYEYVAGDQNLVLYGDQKKIVQKNQDQTIDGNTKSTYNGTVTSTYEGTVTNNYGANNTAEYNATYDGTVHNEYDNDVTNEYKGVLTTTAYGVDQKYTFGAMLNVRLGFNFDFTLAVPLVNITFGLYVRFLNLRITYFDAKFDYVVTLKFDKGSFNVNKWLVGFESSAVKAAARDVSMKSCIAAMALTTVSSVVTTATIKLAGMNLNA